MWNCRESVSITIHREFTCEIQVKFVWRSMWNCIAIHWEFACEICVINHVKFYGKSVWIYMWNSIWNAGENVCERVDITSHPFHTCFTMQFLITHVWNMSVKFMWKVVKSLWNKCENTHYSHIFSHIFYIHTPSSIVNRHIRVKTF